VVNEAVDDDSTRFLRNSLWYQICGDEFIIKAFQYAHEADPAAILFYNDYNSERPEKRECIYRLLKQLKEANVPVQGVGLQAHWSLSEPTEIQLRTAIEQFASLGVTVQFTEVDMSVYPWEKEKREKRPGESDAYSAEKEQLQADQYKMVFRVFREYKKLVSGVTFWNITDKTTWLDHYPVEGRKNYPLLFGQDGKPKKAYYEVTRF
jgi:endo-1,4-beta-xylanase